MPSHALQPEAGLQREGPDGTSHPSGACLFVFLGTGEALVWPMLGALATEEGRTYGQGSMMGVFNMAMSVGIFVGSLVARSLVDTVGLNALFTIVGVFVAGAAVTSAMLIGLPASTSGPQRPPTVGSARKPPGGADIGHQDPTTTAAWTVRPHQLPAVRD